MSSMLVFAMTATLLSGAGAHAQTSNGPGCCGMGRGAISGAPTVEIKGRVSQVRIVPGQGMPFVIVKNGTEESTIYLGSMRYLLEQNFNPKVGDEVVVKAYKTPNGLFASTATLTESKQTIRLRDESGRPVWRGGPRW